MARVIDEKKKRRENKLKDIFRKRLKDLMDEHKDTSNSLSVKLSNEVSDTAIQNVLKYNNSSLPSLYSLKILCDYYNVSADYLLGRTEVNNPSESYRKVHPLVEKYPAFFDEMLMQKEEGGKSLLELIVNYIYLDKMEMVMLIGEKRYIDDMKKAYLPMDAIASSDNSITFDHEADEFLRFFYFEQIKRHLENLRKDQHEKEDSFLKHGEAGYYEDIEPKLEDPIERIKKKEADSLEKK